jgi:hypothetical protein
MEIYLFLEDVLHASNYIAYLVIIYEGKEHFDVKSF